MMTTFKQAVKKDSLSGKTLTENGMVTRVSSGEHLVDLFYKWGASRNLTEQERLNNFTKAYDEDKVLAVKMLLWGRDVRGGAGERKYFREVYKFLAINNPSLAKDLIPFVVELGRWDDLFVLMNTPVQQDMLSFYSSAILKEKNGLAAKWAPREKSSQRQVANALRDTMNLSPKEYRKTISQLTKVVESQMCSGDWDNINFSHVPSCASRLYTKAFSRHTSKYAQYLSDLANKKDGVKINASSIFPHDVIRGWEYLEDTDSKIRMNEQWDALPNWIPDDNNILAMVDVSGSMNAPVSGTKTTCMDVALSLGLYISDKTKGAFNNVVLTFSSEPQIVNLPNFSITEKLRFLSNQDWGMSTNIEKAFKKILQVAVDNKLPSEEMPKMLLILSDMQFDRASAFNGSAYKNFKNQYKAAGYELPSIVFWNLNSKSGVPVKSDKSGVALVSGFSPSILSSILSSNDMTPYGIMIDTLNNPRYDYMAVTNA
jgi:hypothetical protein